MLQEASMNVRKLYDSSVAYFESEHASATGAIIAKQFPDPQVALVPATRCCTQTGGKCAPAAAAAGWQNPTWTSLNFSVDDPFYYQYAYNSGGTEGTSTFRAGAYGDLDRNNIFSTYERAGSVDAQLNVTGGAGLYVVNDIE